MSYEIEYSPEAVEHLAALSARDRGIVMDAVDKKLANEATVETKNRKRMRPNPVAPWELRVGSFRRYYDVCEEERPLVQVLAIGIKVRNRVRIGGEVVEL